MRPRVRALATDVTKAMTDRPFPTAHRRSNLWQFALAIAAALALSPALAAPPDVSPMRVVVDAASAPAPQQLAGDHILLVSTRPLGTRCDGAAMAAGVHCEQMVRDARGNTQWRTIPWSAVLAEFAQPLPTVVYVHGNRVDPGVDKSHGLGFYRALPARKAGAPMRYVIWSWPSSQVRGRIKDYEVKAARTGPAGWQLAWTVDQWPTDSPLALVGYSYGARVVSGALHVLGGGTMDQMALPSRVHPNRPPMRAALLAAAMDASWLRIGGYHGRAVSQVDRLVLVNNQLDPAMRFYPISPVGRHATALGYSGPVGSLGPFATRIQSFDLTEAVGRHHALAEYLAAAGQVNRALELVVNLPPVPRDAVESSLAGRTEPGDRQ
jgi:hypothetical protein